MYPVYKSVKHLITEITTGTMQRLVDLLKHHSPHVCHPALRTVGNIVTGDDMQTQSVINTGVLKNLQELLQDAHPVKSSTINMYSANDR